MDDLGQKPLFLETPILHPGRLTAGSPTNHPFRKENDSETNLHFLRFYVHLQGCVPGWWFEICFYVHPENWGFMIQFDEHIVQNDGLKSPARYNSANGCSCNMMYILY